MHTMGAQVKVRRQFVGSLLPISGALASNSSGQV